MPLAIALSPSNPSKTQPFVCASVSPSEKKLIEEAKKGRAEALGELCQASIKRLFPTIQRITKSREDAEDALQDSFLRAFVHIQEFDERSSFSTWLTRIAINSALMILRKKKGSLEIPAASTDQSGDAGSTYEIADRAPNPERLYAQSEEERILRRAVRGLRPSLRRVVEIQHLQERSVGETARAMRITVAAAKGRLFHAKAALRKSSILKLMNRRRAGVGIRVLTAA